MSIRNLRFTMTRGETGKVLWFKLEPTNAEGVAEAVDISDWVVTLTVSKNGTNYIDDALCVADLDQVANIGEGTFTFDETQADLVAGEYRLRIKGIDTGANIYYFPTLPNRTYGMLKVLAQ